jgi:hypothetical protein
MTYNYNNSLLGDYLSPSGEHLVVENPIVIQSGSINNTTIGNTIPSSGYFRNLSVNGTGVSLTGHTHVVTDITDFNSGVSGLLPVVNDSGDNRILTSDGTNRGINAESLITASGSSLQIGSSGLIRQGQSAPKITLYSTIDDAALISFKNSAGNDKFNIIRDDEDDENKIISFFSPLKIDATNQPIIIVSNGLLYNGTQVSVSGHSHIASNITDFNSSVSGLLPSVSGSGFVNSSFSNNTYTISVTGLQPSGDYAAAEHTHESSNITDFNSSVSGLLTVTNISQGSGILVSENNKDFTISTDDSYIEDLIQDNFNTNLIAGSGIVLTYDEPNLTIGTSGLQPSGNYSVVGHTHIISEVSGLQNALDSKQPSGVYASGVHSHEVSDITDFNSGVSGLLPTIANSGDNRLLTSTGTSTGINAESNATFDGTILAISGNIIVDNLNVAATGDIDTLKINNFYHQNLAIASGLADNDLIIAIIDPTGSPTTEVIQGSVLRSSLLNQPSQLQFRQGTNAERLLIAPASGEPIWTTDTQKFYIGDGTTVGGDFVGPSPYDRGTGDESIVALNNGCSASGDYSVVGGGTNNTASANYSTVCGGWVNSTIGSMGYSTVCGGGNNTSSGYYSYVGGGSANTSSSDSSVVCGGMANTANQWYAFVGGGYSNSATGNGSFVGGGRNNSASSYLAFVGGGTNNTSGGDYGAIAGGEGNSAVGFWNVIGGGKDNATSNNLSTVGGGGYNTASDSYSTTSGGVFNTASNLYDTVGGGFGNTASGSASTVSGGVQNTANNYNSTVGGGKKNTSSGYYSTVGGGQDNTASVDFSTISGGYQAKASRYGENSHAAGNFGNSGDAQHTILIARKFTNNNTANQVLFLDNSSARLTLPAKTSWTFEVKLSAYNDTDSASAGWIYRGVIKRDGSNNTALVGSLIEENWKDAAMNSASSSVIADDTNEALEIRVTGLSGKNIRWVAVIDISQVSYGTP